MMPVVTLRIGSFHGAILALREWGRRMAEHLVQNVPEEMSYCEYDCQDPRCNSAKHAVCLKYSSNRERGCLRIE